MIKSKLQLFGEAVSGRKIVYLLRQLSKASTEDAFVIAFTTNNERTKSKDAESTATKDGPVRTPGTSESELSITALLAKGSTTIDDLEDAMDDDEKIEIWEVNLAEPGTDDNAGKYKARYFQGYLTEVGLTSEAESHAEVSLSLGLEGKGAKGYATVTEQQQEIANYVFADTQKTGA